MAIRQVEAFFMQSLSHEVQLILATIQDIMEFLLHFQSLGLMLCEDAHSCNISIFFMLSLKICICQCRGDEILERTPSFPSIGVEIRSLVGP